MSSVIRELESYSELPLHRHQTWGHKGLACAGEDTEHEETDKSTVN